MYGYIYMTVNKINGKTYIGQHKSMKFCHQDKYMGSGKNIKRAFKKYGIENFEKLLVQYVETKEEADKQERFWIAHYRERGMAQYNITNGGEGVFGLKHSEKSRIKMSEAQKEHYSSLTEEERKLRYGSAHKGKAPWNKGIKENLSDECRRKMSEAKRGKKLSEEHKRKLSESEKGRHCWYKGMTWKLVDGKRVWVKKEEK